MNKGDSASLAATQWGRLFCAAWIMLGLAGCAGTPGILARGSVDGQALEARVDSEAARYYLENYLTGKRGNTPLDARLDRLHERAGASLPDRDMLKSVSEEFSLDLAALFFADRVTRDAASARFRAEYIRAYRESVGTALAARASAGAAPYEFVLVPAYLYKRHPTTGADLAQVRAALQAAGYAHTMIETDEEGAIEDNAKRIAAALTSPLRHGKKLILVSLSKSGPEVAQALTGLDPASAARVAAWVNITGTLHGSPYADYALRNWHRRQEDLAITAVQSMATERSRQRFSRFKLQDHVLVVSLFGIPLTSSFSLVTRSAFMAIREHGPNDGFTLLTDMVYPGSYLVPVLGRDHFMAGGDISMITRAMARTVIGWLSTEGAPLRGQEGVR